MKLIFAVWVYKYLLLGFFILVFVFFFNQSCCLVHSKVTFCFSQILFLMFFSMLYCIFSFFFFFLFFGGKQIDFNEKKWQKMLRMRKFHHTEAKRWKIINFLGMLFFRWWKKQTVSHRPKLCAIETSRDVGIGAHGGVSVSSQTMKWYWFLHRKMVTLG